MFAVVELKYDVGRTLIVPVRNIMNFRPKFSKTDDFLCFWSSNIEETLEHFEWNYQKAFTGERAIFKVFVVTLADSIEEAEKYLNEKRVKSVAKRFRDPQNTDEEMKSIEKKKKRSTKKTLNALIAKAHQSNIEYLRDELSSKEESSLKEIAKTPNTNSTNLLLDLSQQPGTSTGFSKEPNCTLSTFNEQGSKAQDVLQSSSSIDCHLPDAAIPSTSFDQLVADVMSDKLNFEFETNIEENTDPVVQVVEAAIPVPDVPNTQSNLLNSNEIVVVNVDELTNNYNDLVAEVKKLKKEKDLLKIENELVNKRNRMLQDYLVAVNERVPELLFEEKNGGRLYRGGVFLNKKQCLALEKSKTDREYVNNLATAIYGRDILSTHSITGLPSNKTKSAPKLKLESTKLQLIYDIMEARSVINKSTKMRNAEINEIIGKKCTNLSAYVSKNTQNL